MDAQAFFEEVRKGPVDHGKQEYIRALRNF
jgi:hypothetical protein